MPAIKRTKSKLINGVMLTSSEIMLSKGVLNFSDIMNDDDTYLGQYYTCNGLKILKLQRHYLNKKIKDIILIEAPISSDELNEITPEFNFDVDTEAEGIIDIKNITAYNVNEATILNTLIKKYEEGYTQGFSDALKQKK